MVVRSVILPLVERMFAPFESMSRSFPVISTLQATMLLVQIVFVAARQSGDTLRPIFKPTPRNVTVGVGERAVLRCKVENLGTRTVVWRRQGETHPLTIGLFTFAPDPRLSVDFNQRTSEWSLILTGVRPNDDGLYHCQVTVKNAAPQDNSYDVRLHVATVQLSGTEFVELGNAIEVQCNASGQSTDAPPSIEWFFDGQPLYSDVISGLFITTKVESNVLHSMVRIHTSRLKHHGVYTCRTANGDSASMTVHILNGISAERIISDHERLPSRSSAADAVDTSVIRRLLWQLILLTFHFIVRVPLLRH